MVLSGYRDPGGPLADALLAAEAVSIRASRGDSKNPMPGLGIIDDDVDRLVRQLKERAAAASRGAAHEPEPHDDARLADRARRTYAKWLTRESMLSGIVDRAMLTPRQAELLGFLVAVELDLSRQKLVAYIQDDVTKVRPTLWLMKRLFGREGVLALAAEGRMRRAGLVTVDDTATWAAQTVTLASPVTWALVGDPSLDPELPPSARVETPDVDSDGAPLVLVVGPDRTRRLEAAFAHTAGSSFLVTPPPAAPDSASLVAPDPTAAIRGWQAIVREATVGGSAILLEVDGDLDDVGRWWLERADHVPWAISSPTEIPLHRLPRRQWTEVRAAEPETSDVDWRTALGDEIDHRGHRLSANQLRLVADALPGLDHDLDATVRRLASGPLDKLARRIRPRRSWDDLILTPDKKEQLAELCIRYRQRDTVYNDWQFPMYPSIGVVSLFSGASGTGKTLAAEVIAGDLGLDLFKIDLSSMVSKYIGETEKNMEEVFQAASGGSVVLFFDEADSVFGKRAETTDARDRYANMEVSYLLQRIEAYDGLVVLATNFQKNIDEAFVRRIHVSVDFAMPEPPERERIWRHVFPPTAPVDDVDFDFLANQFKIAGGNITSAALHAAFLAADAGDPITMEWIIRALKREFQKMGRLRTEADFGKYADRISSNDPFGGTGE
jgi:AAA+ superfamily predicted ATPase